MSDDRTTKKDQIISVATRLFSRQGFHLTTTSLIAREANVGEGTIFHHFKNKDELFVQCVFTRIKGISNGLDESLSRPQTAREKLKQFIDYNFSNFKQDRDLFKIVFHTFPHGYERWCNDIAALMKEHSDRVGSVLQQGVDEGVFEIYDLELATATLVNIIRGMGKMWVQSDINRSPEELSNYVYNTAIRLFSKNGSLKIGECEAN
jgi:AcrR family transcriptional regulator